MGLYAAIFVVLFMLLQSSRHFGADGQQAICSQSIDLTAGQSTEVLINNGTSPCIACETTITSPPGTTLKIVFGVLQIPFGNRLKIMNDVGDDVVSVSNISVPLDPVYSYLSRMSIRLNFCGGSIPGTYFQVELSYSDSVENITNGDLVLASGGHFLVNESRPSLTLRTSAFSAVVADNDALHWFIRAGHFEWLRLDVLALAPRNGEVCFLDSLESYGTWVCMKESVSPNSWYSQGNHLWINYFVRNRAAHVRDAEMTVRVSIVDSNLWNQTTVIPSCNPTAQVTATPGVRLASPLYSANQNDFGNVRYQCRMRFNSGEGTSVRVQYHQIYDHTSITGIYSKDSSSNRVSLADIGGAAIAITSWSPMTTISLNDVYIDLTRSFLDPEAGILLQGTSIAFALDDPGPVQSLGAWTHLNETALTTSFTTPGYPNLPKDIEIWWTFENLLRDQHAVFVLEFIGFDVGSGTVFVHVAESSPPILHGSSSTVPDVIYASTSELTILVRSSLYCTNCRGLHFNISAMIPPSTHAPSTTVSTTLPGTTQASTTVTRESTSPSSVITTTRERRDGTTTQHNTQTSELIWTQGSSVEKSSHVAIIVGIIISILAIIILVLFALLCWKRERTAPDHPLFNVTLAVAPATSCPTNGTPHPRHSEGVEKPDLNGHLTADTAPNDAFPIRGPHRRVPDGACASVFYETIGPNMPLPQINEYLELNAAGMTYGPGGEYVELAVRGNQGASGSSGIPNQTLGGGASPIRDQLSPPPDYQSIIEVAPCRESAVSDGEQHPPAYTYEDAHPYVSMQPITNNAI